MLFHEAVEQRLIGCSSDLLKRERPDAGERAGQWSLVDQHRLRLLSLHKRIQRDLPHLGQFDFACPMQRQQKAAANHVSQRAVGLLPLPRFAKLHRQFSTTETGILSNELSYKEDERAYRAMA